MTSAELIIEVRKKKYQIIIVTLLIFAVAFVFQYRVLQTFSGTSTIIVNETNVTDLTGPSQFIGDFVNTNPSSVNRLFKLVYSSEMMTHLIKKFRLYEYYQIKEGSEFAYEKLVAKLAGRINLKKSDQYVIDITVTDKDRFQAASIANEISLRLNTLNENYIKSQLRRKVTIYEAIYAEVQKDLDNHENKMIEILKEYNGVILAIEKNKADVTNLKYSLIELSNSLKNKREELAKMKQLYSVYLNTLNKEHLETITIINFALPDYHSNTSTILIGSLAFALFSTCVMILMLNVYITHKKTIDLLFKK